MTEQRWLAAVKDEVTEHVLALRDDERTLRRFFTKVDYGFDADDCRVWTGALNDEGYGVFKLGRIGEHPPRVVKAHRVSWIWAHGAPPADAPMLDHSTRCIGRFCVHPALTHLEPVDHAENVRRGTGVGRAGQRAMRWAELALRDERRARGEPEVF